MPTYFPRWRRSAAWLPSAVTWSLLLCSSLTLTARGAEPVKSFTLPDTHGRDRSLTEFADSPLIVVAFLGTECPLARLYAPRLQELSQQYAERGVAFVGIDSNQQDSLTEIAAFGQHHGIKFPLLKDHQQQVADQFGAVRNPQVFVLDEQRTVRYRGRIDDQYGLGASSGYARTEVQRRDLGIALDELLAGKAVSQPTTEALGCLIGRQPKVEPHGDVTYTKHIAPLLQEHCVSCHRADEIGPFALTDYDEVVGWADMMREVVAEGRMPPWSANPEFGHFANDARLSDEQKQLLYDWVDNGCPPGDPADLPPPRQWTAGWRISPPDQVMKMRRSYQVPAEGVVSYQYFPIDPGWDEDKWIQQAEVRPGNAAVVHHIIVFVVPPGGLGKMLRGGGTAGESPLDRLRRLRQAEGGPEQQAGPPAGRRAGGLEARGAGLTAYVPGSAPTVHEPGVATFVPKGSKLIFQMHYTPNGTAQEDRSYLGVVFADPKSVKKRIHGGAVMNRGFTIPPEAANHEVTSERLIASDQLLVSMSPHMHLRGKSFRYEAIYPDGHHEVLLDVPRYDFNWQLRYVLAEPKLLPAGTKLHCTAHFDNSADNLANPDPEDTVRWGPQTWHEMMIGFFSTVSVEDDAQLAAADTEEE